MRVLLPALAAGAAARTAAAHRVAVLVSGTRPATNATWYSLKTYVLDALEARGTAYEAFACGEPGQAVPPFATEVAASHATPEARLAACYAAAVGKAAPRPRCSCGVLYSLRVVRVGHRVPRPRRVDGATCHAVDAMPHAGDGARRAPRRPSRTFSRRGPTTSGTRRPRFYLASRPRASRCGRASSSATCASRRTPCPGTAAGCATATCGRFANTASPP